MNTFETENQSEVMLTPFSVTEGTHLDDKSYEINKEHLCSSELSLKRKLIVVPDSCKRQRIDTHIPVSDEDNVHDASRVHVGQQLGRTAIELPMLSDFHELREATKVKVKYIIAEKEVRRERAQNGRASQASIAALINAGEYMRTYFCQKIEAIRIYWEHEVDELIVSEKAMFEAR